MPETIDRAAILYEGKVWSLPQPARHCDVFQEMRSAGIDLACKETQGFVTSTGRFVRREPAMRIAKKSGQIKGPTFQPRTLFSEDVW